MAAGLRLEITTPTGQVYSKDVDMVTLPGQEGEMGILPLHVPLIALLGDGEIDEGQVWEAAMTSAHYKLDNVCAIIDFNKLQIDGFCCDIKDMGPYIYKWMDFGWSAIEKRKGEYDWSGYEELVANQPSHYHM